MKNNKRLITMVSTLCALVLLFIVYKVAASMNDAKQRQLAAEEAAKNAVTMIADYNYRDAVSLSYQKKGQDKISIEIQNDRWVYAPDTTFPLNQTTAAYMANALASMGASSTVNLAEADTTAFGLDDPEWTFTISYKDGSSHTYYQGSYNDFSKAYYFKEEGIDTVYMIVAGLTDFFSYDLHGLADAGTFPIITADKFDSVILTSGGQTVTLSGDDIAASFVDMGNVLQPSAFLDHHINDTTKAQYGLTQPWMEVSFQYKETITVADAEGASSSSNIEQIRTFKLSLGDDVEIDGSTYTPYLADGYTFVYYMPSSVSQTMMTYFTNASIPAEE